MKEIYERYKCIYINEYSLIAEIQTKAYNNLNVNHFLTLKIP